ncbi:hypothetical protein FHH43_08345 [Clostridium perfringens]|nr:hypothetical protein [Clostridium perfringens]
MDNKRVNLYFFGEIGVYDKYSPEYVCNKEFAPEVLYIIAKNNPYTIARDEIINTLGIKEKLFDELITSFKEVNFIESKDNRYKINFPVFLEEDLKELDNYLCNIGNQIGDIIIENKAIIYNKIENLSSFSNFSKERLLYHIICDNIFDGTAIDFFGDKDIFCTSKNQPDNRDYLVIGYEEGEEIESYSNKLLCSSNNFSSKSFNFNSFGDSNGNRKDMYRFFRQSQQKLENITSFKEVNLAYIKIIENKNREIAEDCGNLILKVLNFKVKYLDLNKKEKDLADFLIKINYLSLDEVNEILKCDVPIFTKEDRIIIEEISSLVLNETLELIRNFFIDFEKGNKNLMALKHKVDIKEVANELWHQIFGLTNEYLVKNDFVEKPMDIKGEGRYLRSLSFLN